MPAAVKFTETLRQRRGHRFFPLPGDRVPALYSQEARGEDATVHLHYFVGSADWYITEYDPETGEAFGWAEIVPGMGEYGYVDLVELEAVTAGPLRQPVERDCHWTKVAVKHAKKRR